MRRRTAARLVLFGALTVATGCVALGRTPPPHRGESWAQERTDEGARALFAEAGVDGAFVLLDERRAVRTIVNREEAATRHVPASTFKIASTLIGLETGVIAGEHFSLPWDGREHAIAAWNGNHDLRSAIRHSVVWFYQEVARRVGAARMRHWLNAFDYGDKNMGGAVDTFWLDDTLHISPREQVEFLRRLHARELPVKDEHAALTVKLLVSEEWPTPDGPASIRAKTGWSTEGDRAVLWLVGFVERGMDRYTFATLLLCPKAAADEKAALRWSLSKRLLVRAGALPVLPKRDGCELPCEK